MQKNRRKEKTSFYFWIQELETRRALSISLWIAIEGQLNADGTVDHTFHHMLDLNTILFEFAVVTGVNSLSPSRILDRTTISWEEVHVPHKKSLLPYYFSAASYSCLNS
jgi:hypothetical protein